MEAVNCLVQPSGDGVAFQDEADPASGEELRFPVLHSLGCKAQPLNENIRPVMGLVEGHFCKLQYPEFIKLLHWWS